MVKNSSDKWFNPDGSERIEFVYEKRELDDVQCPSNRASIAMAIRALRAIAKDYREARYHSYERQTFEFLLERQEDPFASLWRHRTMPIQVLDALDRTRGEEHSNDRHWLVNTVVGYVRPKISQLDLIKKQRTTILEFLNLCPGAVLEVWPHEFNLIDTRLEKDDDLDKATELLVANNRFALYGYFASACELIADWAENALGSEVSLDAEPSRPNLEANRADGISQDGRTLTWGGKQYSLSPSAGAVVRKLVESYFAGVQFISEQYLKVECEVASDLRHLVRHNNLQTVVVRQKVSGKNVKGMWGMVDPKIIT